MIKYYQNIRQYGVITPVLDPEGERWQWAAINEFAAVSKRARNNLKNSKRLFSSEVLFGWPTCPSSVSVSKSLPVLWNVKSGVVGLSRKGSVWLSTSAQLMTLVTTSRWGSEIDGLRLALSDFDIPHDEMVYVQSCCTCLDNSVCSSRQRTELLFLNAFPPDLCTIGLISLSRFNNNAHL